jgi:hypothetical protein
VRVKDGKRWGWGGRNGLEGSGRGWV